MTAENDFTMVDTEALFPKKENKEVAKTFPVIEIFGPTLQGEGPLAGSKTMFIRFGGCDYRCTKCDSLHAVIPQAVKANAEYLTAEQIFERLVYLRGDTNTAWVTISGGNPLMWDLEPLVDLLIGSGTFAIAVETQGTIYRPWLKKVQMCVISPKSPGMGEKFEPEKFTKLIQQNIISRTAQAIKIVVFSQQDLDFALEVEEIARKVSPEGFAGMMFLSLGNELPPVLGEDLKLHPPEGFGNFDEMLNPASAHKLQLLQSYQILVADMLMDPRMVFWRFLPQLHVLLYSNESER